MTQIVVWASRWNEMRDFYLKLLNARIIVESNDFVHIAEDSNEVMLHRIPAEFLEASDGVTAREDSPLKPVFTLYSDSSLGLFQVLREFKSSGWFHYDFMDPDGNIIAVRIPSEK
ncbi:MAG: hypothetical protein RIS09_748 [Actinomycetota bacterium]|jgi:hypothetical protein